MRVAAKPIPDEQVELPREAFPHVPVPLVVALGFEIVE
jgi:hypothetical protein